MPAPRVPRGIPRWRVGSGPWGQPVPSSARSVKNYDGFKSPNRQCGQPASTWERSPSPLPSAHALETSCPTLPRPHSPAAPSR